MSDFVVPFRPRDVPVDPPAEALDHLEDQAGATSEARSELRLKRHRK